MPGTIAARRGRAERNARAAAAVLAAWIAGSCGGGLDYARPPAHTELQLSVRELRFAAELTGGDPQELSVTVRDAGGGSLAPPTAAVTYPPGSGSGWLSTAVDGSGPRYTVAVRPRVAGLTVGTYSASVAISSEGATNSPQVLAVTLTTTPGPIIGLSDTLLAFVGAVGGADPAARLVSVSNAGSGTLAPPTVSVVYLDGSGWLEATAGGDEPPYSVSVQPRLAGLAPGTYEATVSVASPGAGNSPQPVTVTLEVDQAVIALAPTSLAFQAAYGGPDPAPQAVTVTNAGTGALAPPAATVSYGAAGTGWLTATVSGAAAPYAVTVQPSVAGLGAGSYDATVSVAAAGAGNTPQSFPVTLTVTRPTLALAPTSLAFTAPFGGPNPAAQAVSVGNSGTGTLAAPAVSIAYGSGSGWLTATVSGTAAPYAVTVQPAVGALAAGTYTATLSVSSPLASNSPQTVPVTLTVTRPMMVLAPTSLSFTGAWGGANPAPQAVAVSNSASGTLAAPTATVAYTSGTGWLTATVSGAAAPYTVTVQASLGALAAGSYAATVSIASAGAGNTPQPLPVTLTITRPTIALSATALAFSAGLGGANPAAQLVTVSNTATGTLALPTATVAYTSGAGWLTATVSGAAAPYAVSVQPSIAGLAAGSYAATVSIASAGASNTPQAVAVTLTITPPTLAVSPASLTFAAGLGGANPAAQALTVSNAGGGVLALPTATVAYTSGAGWLTATVSGAAAPYAVTVQPSIAGLAAGTYAATVSIASAGASNTPRAVPVTLTITPPTLALSPASLTFTAAYGGPNPAAQAVTVGNGGGGVLALPTATVAYASGTGWLTATVSGAAAPYAVTVQPDASALGAGTYTATVSIASAGASNTPQSVPVTLTVTRPTMLLSAAALTFSADFGTGSPAAQNVLLTNTGNGSLAQPTTSVAYAQGSGWLGATVSGNPSQYTIAVQPNIAGLAVGTYGATLSIASANASNTPQAVAVTLTITQPTIGLSAASLTFDGPSPAAQVVTVSNTGTGNLALPTTSVAYAQGSGWLSAAVSGSAAPYTVAVQPLVAGLAAGTYGATLSIASAGATNTPQTVAVTLTVPPPTMGLSGTALAFTGAFGGSSPAAQNVTVSNTGGGILALPATAVAYGTGSGWLAATVSGTAAPYTVRIQPALAGLTGGTYTATVSIDSAGATNTPQTVAVTLTVTQPTMQLSTSALGFTMPVGTRPAAQVVTVGNVGTGTLTRPTAPIVYGTGSGWLSATASGSAAPYSISIRPSTGANSLAAGTYTATVNVTQANASNTPQPVAVTLVVGARMDVQPTALDFAAAAGGPDPAAQAVTVGNTGGGSLAAPSVTVDYGGGTAGWLAAAVSGSAAPYTVSVQPAVASLAAGVYTATLSIASAGASNSPQAVLVSLTVQ